MCRAVYEEWFRDHGGSIVNIIADMWNGFPGMAYVITSLPSPILLELKSNSHI